MNVSGTATHSKCHGPFALSKSLTIPPRTNPTFALRTFEAANTTSLKIGFRFCGIVDDAARCGTKGSETSPSSFEDAMLISNASFPRNPPTKVRKFVISATVSRATCYVSASGDPLPPLRLTLEPNELMFEGSDEKSWPAEFALWKDFICF